MADLHAALDALSRTSGQLDAAGFIERNRALDQLEVLIFELVREPVSDQAAAPRSPLLAERVLALRDRLQALNDSVVQRLRERIASGSLSHGELMSTFRQYVDGARRDSRDHVQYDDLDALVAAVLSTDKTLDDRAAESHPEMVGYQPTPARLVLELIGDLLPTERDVFVDIGSGLGTVPMLVALLTDARTIGIELNPSYCAYAQACGRALNVSSVSFVRQDAREADFSVGTIFYMFTPFKGSMLRSVLERLAGEGRRRRIQLCVHGPLLREAAQVSAAFSIETARGHDALVSVFQSVPVS